MSCLAFDFIELDYARAGSNVYATTCLSAKAEYTARNIGAASFEVLREAESGETVVEVCRKHGISQQTFYLWKKKYSGLG